MPSFNTPLRFNIHVYKVIIVHVYSHTLVVISFYFYFLFIFYLFIYLFIYFSIYLFIYLLFFKFNFTLAYFIFFTVLCPTEDGPNLSSQWVCKFFGLFYVLLCFIYLKKKSYFLWYLWHISYYY